MPRFAAIDVGSNAIRLRIVEATGPANSKQAQLQLLAEDSDSAGWEEVVNLRSAVRLGAEVFSSGRLAPGSIGRACEALRTFRAELDRARVDAYRAVATSAVREAKNGAVLIERARREAGIELETIEAIEEARLIQLAVTRRLALGARRALLVDVGGGSTELTLLDRGQAEFTTSLPIGTVRLLETYMRGVQTMDHARERLIDEAIERALAEVLPHVARVELLVTTGGSVDTLLELCPAEGLGRAINVSAARALFKKMRSMTANERRDAWQLRPDRADTILPALAIFLHCAAAFDQSVLIAPGVGLSAGVLAELSDRFFDVWDIDGEAHQILEACARLGRRYRFDEPHARHVAQLAAQLFDDLQAVHAFTDRDRLLLRCAALLHDIGDYVHYSGHHKHSYYLILHSDIMGIRPEERAIIANLARYHRKGPPETAHVNFRDLSKEARGKVRGLAAILRIADALDREHRQKIEHVRAEVDPSAGRVILFLRGDEERELEEWSLDMKASMWRDEYDLDVFVAKEAPKG
ncbi:MAG: Ppx/GppA phosphatase family protein [Polyangiaceae bacterium]|jgi:exopolyphosphatase/guanosine-5'-triphosphate,3'-diphosphate pyrophosphatase